MSWFAHIHIGMVKAYHDYGVGNESILKKRGHAK